MSDSSIQYPNIVFVDTDTEILVNSLVKAYEVFHEKMTGKAKPLYPADPIRLFILWLADIITQERVIIDTSAKQNVPRYAEGEYLDSIAEIFKDVKRSEAKPAITTIRFFLSEPQPSAQIIPKGTRVTVDGEIIFATTAAISIPPEMSYGDSAAECQTVGEIGNGFLPGQITQLIDLYPFYAKVENVTTSEGGAELESDETFYNRMRESPETFSTAGPSGAYIYHTKSASAKITDVVAKSTDPGIVDIYVLLENGELPDEEMVQLIQKTLSADKVRPLTDYVRVSPPNTIEFNIDIKYYISNSQSANAVIIQKEVEVSIDEYIKWQTKVMGRDINPDELIYLLKKAGAKRVVITEPSLTYVNDNEIAFLGDLNVVFGGLEDE